MIVQLICSAVLHVWENKAAILRIINVDSLSTFYKMANLQILP